MVIQAYVQDGKINVLGNAILRGGLRGRAGKIDKARWPVVRRIRLNPACFCTCFRSNLAVLAHREGCHKTRPLGSDHGAEQEEATRCWPTPVGEQACTYTNALAKSHKSDKRAI